MFPTMRRQNASISEQEAYDVLERCQEGVLGTIGINDYPHTVPVNYVVYQGKIYIHCAKEGFKLQNISQNPKVSFTAYDLVTINQEKFTTKFESVIVYGLAVIKPGNTDVLMEFIKKYSIPFLEQGKAYVKKEYDSAFLIEITIQSITGKKRS